MKKWWIILVLLVATSLPMVGCVTVGGKNWQNNIPQLKADVFMFSKMATRIALTEAKMESKDVQSVKGYLEALRDLLAVPGSPNFGGARVLVTTHLQPKYRIYGFTIIDILERYISTANLNITEDQELIIAIVSSGINGAIEGVQEFAG